MYYIFEWMDGKAWLAIIEPEVIGELDMRSGEPELQVKGLVIDRVDILKSPSPTVRALALEIKETIQNDGDWLSDLAEENGYTYQTLGGTDPDARWVSI